MVYSKKAACCCTWCSSGQKKLMLLLDSLASVQDRACVSDANQTTLKIISVCKIGHKSDSHSISVTFF